MQWPFCRREHSSGSHAIFANFENVLGGSGNDTLIGTSGDNFIGGNAGK